MQKEIVTLNQRMLVGVTTKTNNQNEMNPEKSKIGAMVGAYFGNQVANHFQHRVQPGVTYSVYTDYETDEYGEYTYFIGEEVSSEKDQDLTQFHALIIPSSAYVKFTTAPGKCRKS